MYFFGQQIHAVSSQPSERSLAKRTIRQPWEDVSLYRARSPVFQAKGVTTPTLVQHGEADVRVPVSQGYEFYNAVKQQGTPAEMLVLPRQPHGPNEPRMILKIMQTNLDWFEKHLGQSRSVSSSGRDK